MDDESGYDNRDELISAGGGECDVYVGGKVRVSELLISLDLRLCGSK